MKKLSEKLRTCFAGMLMLGALAIPQAGLAATCDVTVSDAQALHNAIQHSNRVVCVEPSGSPYNPHPTSRETSFRINGDNITIRGLGAPGGVVLSGNNGDLSINTDNSKNVVTVKARSGIVLENLTIADAYNDELPYWLQVDGRPHLVVPYTLGVNDSKFGHGQFATGQDFYTYAKDSFDMLYREGASQPKMM